MPVFKAEELERVAFNILKAAGTQEYEAKIVSENLIKSNLYGHDSHGIINLPRYIRSILKGELKLGIKAKVVNETPSTAVLDGGFGFGFLLGKQAMEMAIEKAKKTGIGMVSLFNTTHTGRVGEYPELALKHNMIGFAIGGGSLKGSVAVFGGATKIFGTNPLSVSIPTLNERPILVDMATSVAAGGKIRVAQARGEKVPLGWILDSEGRQTTDPAQREVMLPWGGYKGAAIQIINHTLGILACPARDEKRGGFIFMAINIDVFRSVDEFKEDVDELIRTVKASKKMPGVKDILIAGEPEYNTREKRLKEGIPIEEETWKDLKSVAEEVGLDLKKFLKTKDLSS